MTKTSTRNTTKKIARLAIFLAIGVVLNIIEAMFPIPVPVPGVKLGLANTMGLIVLFFYGPIEYLAIGFLRVIIVALLRTGLGSPAFFLALGGWFLASVVTIIMYLIFKPSIYGLSATSALFHPVGQIIVACIYYNQIYFINYLLVLLITSLISGLLVAYLSSGVLRVLSRTLK